MTRGMGRTIAPPARATEAGRAPAIRPRARGRQGNGARDERDQAEDRAQGPSADVDSKWLPPGPQSPNSRALRPRHCFAPKDRRRAVEAHNPLNTLKNHGNRSVNDVCKMVARRGFHARAAAVDCVVVKFAVFAD